jgi:hypothetical protein
VVRRWWQVRSVGTREGFGAVNVSWRALGQADVSAVTDLARQCLSADGGQPFAADPGFLSGWYAFGAETHAGWDGQRLGETAITLNVNLNNPHAAMLYVRLGFTTIGRRARYRS